jgi:cation diffusion facilitator family transporter
MLLSPSGVRIVHVALDARCLYPRARHLTTTATTRAAVRIVAGSTYASRSERYPNLRAAFFPFTPLRSRTRRSMASISSDVRQRRGMANNASSPNEPEHSHSSHDHDHSHSHSHSHGVFGHTHEHDGSSESAKQVVNAFQNTGVSASLPQWLTSTNLACSSAGDAGSRITIIGLVANIGLTSAKGLAGWFMNSAALLADAGHSFSDLIGDVVTLVCWKLSRRTPSELFPYGYAKFETIGTLAVAFLLLGGGFGIAVHATYLLLQALAAPVATLPPDSILVSIYDGISHFASHLPMGHSHGGHGHSHGAEHTPGVLDGNAAWFAAGSAIAKEWLYRATKRVADQENSPVLLANALHHRSDAYSSVVALIAIGGTVAFPHVPLDPIGGFVVSIVIIQQGLSILSGSAKEFTDASVPPATRALLMSSLQSLTGPSTSEAPMIQAITNLRARRAGARTFVEVTAEVDETMKVAETAELERKIAEVLRKARGEVDVVVKFLPHEKH